MSTQKEYWNKVADTKEFTTPMQSAVSEGFLSVSLESSPSERF